MKFAIKKIGYREICKYIGYFLIMLLLANAQTPYGGRPFHLGFFAALVYCRQNVYALSPMYLIALIIVAPSWESLIVGITPPIVFSVLKIAHYSLCKPLKMIHVNLYAFLSQLPLIIVADRGVEGILQALTTIIIAQVFTYCAVIFMYALLIRGARYRFTTDEKVGACVLIGAAALGLFGIDIFGFRPYYLAVTLIILLMFNISTPITALMSAITLGIGAGVVAGNVTLAGGLVFSTAIALIFAKSNCYIATLAYLLAHIFTGYYFNAYGNFGYIDILAAALGCLIFISIPRNYRNKLSLIFGGTDETMSVRGLVNRNRREVNGKLISMGKVFGEMGDLLKGDMHTGADKATLISSIASEISADYCAKCPDRGECTRALGSDTSVVIVEMVERGMEKGEADVFNLPTFISGRCRRAVGLVGVVNSKIRRYRDNQDNKEQISAGRLLLGEQMCGIGELLKDMAADIKKTVSFDAIREKKIAEELSYHNIICRDIMVYGESGCEGVSLVVRDCDANKKSLIGVINKIMKNVYVKDEIKVADSQGYSSLRLTPAPKYGIVYGVSSETMSGSDACGDTYSIGNIEQGKFLLAICDGMGSGRAAHYNSCSTMSMIENFYKAGFDNNSILTLVNKLLSTYNDESFTCLDMCIVDLYKGSADFIKLGGVKGLIKRDNVIAEIEAGALPLGIVEEAKPHTERKMLLEGDILIFMSDGIADALGIEGVKDILIADTSKNPQALSDKILQLATSGGAADDSTVIAARIFVKD